MNFILLLIITITGALPLYPNTYDTAVRNNSAVELLQDMVHGYFGSADATFYLALQNEDEQTGSRTVNRKDAKAAGYGRDQFSDRGFSQFDLDGNFMNQHQHGNHRSHGSYPYQHEELPDISSFKEKSFFSNIGIAKSKLPSFYQTTPRYPTDSAIYPDYDISGYEDYNDYTPRKNLYGYAPISNRNGRYQHFKSQPPIYKQNYGHAHSHTTKYHPVIIHKKKKKKTKKIVAVHHSSMIPNGVRLKTKVKNLHDCEKACEIIPLCFAGDYNPWEKACYLHSGYTACDDKVTNKRTIHFTKIICDVDDLTPRNSVILDLSISGGLEQKHVGNFKDCLQKCLEAGQGIASTPNNAANEGQICFGVDYDFSTHSCFFQVDGDLCGIDTVINPAVDLLNPGTISVQLCPTGTDPVVAPPVDGNV